MTRSYKVQNNPVIVSTRKWIMQRLKYVFNDITHHIIIII